MDLKLIVVQLRRERQAIDKAIVALEKITSPSATANLKHRSLRKGWGIHQEPEEIDRDDTKESAKIIILPNKRRTG